MIGYGDLLGVSNNGIVSRKITKFVTRSSIENEVELVASAVAFVANGRPLLWTFGPSHVKNSDQSSFNRELHTGRTLDLKEMKNVHGKVQQLSATAHSYTVMPIVSAAGVLESLMLLVIQEPSGNFGPRIRKELFKASNLVVRASKSGKMEKRHLADFYRDVYFPTAGDNTALLVDSWPAFADITLLDKANIEKKEMDFAMIPAGTTGMIQPFDVYGFRPWKCFFCHIEDHVALYNLPVVLH